MTGRVSNSMPRIFFRGYEAMAADEAREAEAAAWEQGLIGDVDHEPAGAMPEFLGHAAARFGWVSFDPAIGGGNPEDATRDRRTTLRTHRSTASRLFLSPPQVNRLYPAEAYMTLNGERRKAMADQLGTVSKQASFKRSSGFLLHEDSVSARPAHLVAIEFFATFRSGLPCDLLALREGPTTQTIWAPVARAGMATWAAPQSAAAGRVEANLRIGAQIGPRRYGAI